MRKVIAVVMIAITFSLILYERSTMAYAFEDEFNGPAGSAPDSLKWTYDLGRWTDNNELETYTNSRVNS